MVIEGADTTRVIPPHSHIRVLSWNLYHGRDAAPNPSLFTWRSMLWGRSESDGTHLQVNRSLFPEFSELLQRGEWDVALLQECSPGWVKPLARLCDADSHRSLGARNWMRPITGPLARWNPDVIGSWEGSSNTILVRRHFARIVGRQRLRLRMLPERRTMGLARLDNRLCVANLHASTADEKAAEEILHAAERAVEWAGGDPLIFGGDFNVRPDQSDVFEALERRFGLSPPSDPKSIDHILSRGLDPVEAPRPWPAERREVLEDGLAIRLSDHAPVETLLAARS